MKVKLLCIYILIFNTLYYYESVSCTRVIAQLGHLNHGGGQLKVAAEVASVCEGVSVGHVKRIRRMIKGENGWGPSRKSGR